MDDLFEEMDCGSKTDSIVMTLLRSAMDKAHEDVQSQNGPIEFLHKRSKFYELAAILVDCGLSIVQDQEADILESSREKMLSDLTEIKGWLQRRTEEMQLLIMAKDKELVEREENELKLRHALDLNEREKVYLQEKLEFERINCQEDESHGGGDICELKNSVDQQVLSIKQKLDEDRVSLTRRRRASISCSSHNELYFQLLENNRHSGSELMERVDLDLANHFSGISSLKPNAKQMSSEIDILKGTLDLAFGKMQNAEVFPLERQWRWSIERDMLLVSLHGFIADTTERFRKKWNMFIKETRILHDELQHLYNQIIIEKKQYDKQQMALSTPPQPLALQRTTSEPSLADILSKLDQRKDPDPDPSGSNYVAKLVRNHEFFIRKQREQKDPTLPTREIPQKKGSSFSVKKGNQDPDELVSRITKSIQVMDRLIRWDDNLGAEENSFCDTNDTKNRSEDMRKLRQERDDLELQILVMQEVFVPMFRGSMESLLVELFESGNLEEETLSSIREEVHKVYLVEKTKEWKMEMECKAFDCLLEEEVYRTVLNESIKGIHELMRCRVEMEIEGSETLVSNPSCCSDTVGSNLKEDIHALYLREMLHEWRTEEDDLGIEIVIREDIYAVSLREMLRKGKAETGDLDIEILMREDIYALFMAEMMKEYADSSVEQSGNSERMKYDVLQGPSPPGLDRINGDGDGEHKLEMTVKDSETDDHRAQMDQIENESKRQYVSVSRSLMEFLQDFVEFEYMVHTRLESNSLRVDELKCQMYGLARPASKLRRKKSLYKKAFRIRCQNLSLAENEVDLLGDQVEKLMCLLQNIYLVLHQNSSVLSQYFGVFDILSGIQKELQEQHSRPDLVT